MEMGGFRISDFGFSDLNPDTETGRGTDTDADTETEGDKGRAR